MKDLVNEFLGIFKKVVVVTGIGLCSASATIYLIRLFLLVSPSLVPIGIIPVVTFIVSLIIYGDRRLN